MRGYMAKWNQYGVFFHDYFTWLASLTAYIATVLTAMQVGLATKSLGSNDVFHSASYGFTVFAILGPLIAASLVLILFCCIFIYNWIERLILGSGALAHTWWSNRRLGRPVPSGLSSTVWWRCGTSWIIGRDQNVFNE